MDQAVAFALIRSLLQRIRRGGTQLSAPFDGLVSLDELRALETLVETQQPEAPQKTSPATPAANEPPSLGASHPEPPAPKVEGIPGAPAAHVVPPHRQLELDRTALRLKSPDDASITLCLDFGTARSKAFAATVLGDDVGKLFDLAVGKQAGEADSIYSVNSSVWIDRNGLVFVGAEAIRRSLLELDSGEARQRLDSLKQEISQIPGVAHVEQRRLPPSVNPTAVPLLVEDAITLYLAYLTDVSVSSLAVQHGGPKYVRRRFALPCWDSQHRLWAAQVLARSVKKAVLLADTLQGLWQDGVPAEIVKDLITAASAHEEELGFLIQTDGEAERVAHYGGVLEPIAAGSARVWKDDLRSLSRQLVFVIDVGAGTTDLSLFWVVQDPARRRALPVKPAARAVRMAGDQLDSALLLQLEERAHLGGDGDLRRRVRGALALETRRLKEQLFKLGEVRHRLVNDQIVHLTLPEFLASEGVRNFGSTLEARIQEFLSAVHPSWFSSGGADGLKMVITGGGCDLPMIAALAQRDWLVGDREVRPTLAPRIPKSIEDEYEPDFLAEYPQLAVALGGALPSLLQEGAEQAEWLGGAASPGPLSRYQVTGT